MSQFVAQNQPLWGAIQVKHFCFSETAKRKGLDNRLPVDFLSNAKLTALMVVRCEQLLGRRFNLLQGYRSTAVNLWVGGSPTSLHTLALAVDGIFEGMGMLEACQRIADSNLPIVEIEAKRTMLHLAVGDRSKRRLLWQADKLGPVFRVSSFLPNPVLA